MKNHLHPAPGAVQGGKVLGLCRAQQQLCALVTVSLVPLCPKFPSVGRSCQAGVPHTAQGLGHLSGTRRLPQVKTPLLLHPTSHQRC